MYDPEIQEILRLRVDIANLTEAEQLRLLKLGTKKYVERRLNKGASHADIIRELEAMADACEITVRTGVEGGRA